MVPEGCCAGRFSGSDEVGGYYDLGLGVTKNYKEAVKWYR